MGGNGSALFLCLCTRFEFARMTFYIERALPDKRRTVEKFSEAGIVCALFCI